ncbi:hypothetical protein WA158_007152 [Blastocystis sp. Blastoise]
MTDVAVLVSHIYLFKTLSWLFVCTILLKIILTFLILNYDLDLNISVQPTILVNICMIKKGLNYKIYGDGWSSGAYLYIKYGETNFLTAILNRGEASANVPKLQQFTLNLVFTSDTIWKTSTIAQTGTSWTQMDFDDAAWTPLAPGSFPAVSTTTRYYRYTSSISYAASYALRFGFQIDSGFIIYINGIEASRVGLPTVTDSNTGSLIVDTFIAMKTIVIPLSPYITSGTDFTIAIEVHSHSSQLNTYDVFDGYATTITSTTGEAVTSGGTATCSVESDNTYYVCSNVVDNSDSSQYDFPGNTGTITIALPNGSKTWFNAYQITSANTQSGRDPREWKFYGSEDGGATWILLDHITKNMFAAKSTSYVFNIPSNRKSFNQIKFDILNNNGNSYTQLAEIRTFVTTQALLSPGLQYPSNTLDFNTYAYISVSPISSGIHTFTITPELPTGLFLDAVNGDIFGYVDTAITTKTYTISAIDGATNAPTSFIMAISSIVCQQPTMAQVVITKVNKSTSKDERVVIYNEDNTQIITLTGVNDGDNQKSTVCQPAGRWKFVLFDDGNNGWEKGAYLDVSLKYDLTTEHRIARLYLLAGNTATYYVNTRLDLAPKSNTWKYQQGASSTTLWRTISFSDTNWLPFSYDPLVSVTQNIILLRNTFTITSKTNMVGWELFFKSKDGCVIYVNGNEVYRYNLAAGEINADTGATGGDSSFIWRSVSGYINALSNGNSATIAIGLVNRGIGSYYLDFDGIVHLIGDSNVIQNSSDGTYDSSGAFTDGAAANLFDSNPNTSWITPNHDSISEQWVTVEFNNKRAIYMSKYCIYSNSDAPNYDPADWTIYGSMDGTTWVSITSQSNVSWEERQQRKCFIVYRNYLAYTNYKIAVTKAAVIMDENRYAFSEWEFLIEDANSLVIPAFSLTPSNLVAYKDVPVPALLVSSEYYYDFTISPDLPSGLSMDSSNGYFNGIPTQLQSPTTYTVSAKTFQGYPSTYDITFSVIDCSFPNNLFKLSFYFKNYANEASWTLNDSTGTAIDSRSTSVDYSTQNFFYCRASGIYTLVLSDSKNDGWGEGTYSVFVEDSTTALVSGSLAIGESPKTVTLNIGRIVSTSAAWKYLNDDIEAPSDWNTDSFSDDSWSTGISGSLSAPTGNTQYYRTTFTLATVDAAYAGIDISASTYAGMIIYLNGHEIRRINMPTGTVNYNTAATTEFTSSTSFISSVFIVINPILVVGTNVIAIEIHKKETLPTTNDFTCFVAFIPSGEYRVSDGVAWSDIEKTDSQSTDKLFDNNLNTQVVSGPRCVGAIYQYTFNNDRKEFINHYKITNGNTCNQRSPSSWRIEGSNDNGITWTLLDHEYQQFFTSYGQTFSYDFYAAIPYNSYRFIATECSNTPLDGNTCSDGFQLSEFGLYITSTTSSCIADGTWGPAVEGGYSFQECPIGYAGIQRRLCTAAVFGEVEQLCTLVAPTDLSYTGSPFIYHKNIPVSLDASVTGIELTFTIYPALPNGLTINPSDGTISGTPTTNSDATTYTVTATNTAGSVTTIIMIQIDTASCSDDDNWSITEAGQQATLPCEDTINYEGSRTRLCQLEYPAIWASVVDGCELKMPSISYSTTTITGYKNIAITPILASIAGGNLNPLSINPSLPDGLLLNPITGLIYGIPSSDSSNSYTITVSNARSQSTATITITINTVSCIAENGWSMTEIGEQATLPCEDTINYEGFRTRLCKLEYPAVWEDVINNCQLKMPSIIYDITTTIGYKNIAITPIIASLTGGSLNDLTISPSLPDGLSFNPITGLIHGIPTSDSSNSYTITVSNARGQSAAIITITISIVNCSLDDIWSMTEIGEQATLPCEDPINYEGFRTRLCKLAYPAVWEDVIDNCQLKMPSISYTATTTIGYKNIAIIPVVASIAGGSLNPLSISPSLPDGLSFNNQNGQIYGTPTSASSNTYTITVSNARGQATATITITISIVNCPIQGIWSMTEIGQQATLPCEDPINYEGFRTRLCPLGYPAAWDSVVDICQLKMPSISYNTNTIIGYKNDAINPIMASIAGGSLNPLSISPSLPDGLTFNTQNGYIYGIPTSDSSNSYTITVSNARGQATATITITISIVNCSLDDIWPITERDTTAYIECPLGQSGIQSRVCQNTGVGTASWKVADSSDCFVYNSKENPGDNKVFINAAVKLEGLTDTTFNTPSTIETFRTLIVQSLSTYSIPSSAVKIISVSSLSTYSDGVSVNVRITANESDEDNIKNDINTLFTGNDSVLLKACKESTDSNLKSITNTSINGEIYSKIEKKQRKIQPHKKIPEIQEAKVEKPQIQEAKVEKPQIQEAKVEKPATL